MSEDGVYEVFALRYAELTARLRGDNYIFDDAHDQQQPIDYYVWVARSPARTFVIDTGFDAAEAALRGRSLLRPPPEALASMGLEVGGVTDVIVTHMHYDHAGSVQNFPAARFHIQAEEMAYVTGPCMCFGDLNHPFNPEHVCAMVRNVYAGRVNFCEGDAELAPNLSVHKIGGHTRGLQCVRLLTRRGWLVLASDASHFYENFERRKLFPIVVDAEAMLKGFARLEALAESKDHIVPGHDPLVRARYPAERAELEGFVHRLDVAPR